MLELFMRSSHSQIMTVKAHSHFLPCKFLSLSILGCDYRINVEKCWIRHLPLCHLFSLSSLIFKRTHLYRAIKFADHGRWFIMGTHLLNNTQIKVCACHSRSYYHDNKNIQLSKEPKTERWGYGLSKFLYPRLCTIIKLQEEKIKQFRTQCSPPTPGDFPWSKNTVKPQFLCQVESNDSFY